MLVSNQRPLPCECLLEVSGACKTPTNSSFLSSTFCSSFQEIYSGSAQMSRLLRQHKVRDRPGGLLRMSMITQEFGVASLLALLLHWV